MTIQLTTIKALSETVQAWRAAGETIALVPTMGALHRGHRTLALGAKESADRVIVSIFVNPTQFGPNEDFNRYPRPLAADIAMLREDGIDAVWMPTMAEMYPHGFATSVHVAGISEVLDGTFRPGHFDGVATVVSKLLLQVLPDVAFFGEKDYQQLCVIQRMVQDLNIPVQVLGTPTVREVDGLALSSRNAYLSPDERKAAVHMNRVMRHSASVLKNEGRPVAETMEKGVMLLLDAGFASVDYFTLVDSKTLAPLMQYTPQSRLLVAARLGTTRLIDNMVVE